MNEEEKNITDKLLSFKNEFTPIKVDEKKEEEFISKVKERLNNSIRCKSKIEPLIKNEETFNKSAGKIYFYLEDDEICSKCVKGLIGCPKNTKGYKLFPRYDKDLNAIVTDKLPCEYLLDKNEKLNNIIICDILKDDIYSTSSKLLRNIKNKENKILKDCENLVYSLIQLQKQFLNDKPNTGYVYYSINDEKLSLDMLKFTCYFFASKKYQTAYIRLDNLFEDLKSFNFQVKERSEYDFYRIANVPVLCIENINLLEKRFYKEEMFITYLYPLIKKRHENGKITFASLSQDKTISQLSNSWFYKMDVQSDARDLMSEIFEKKKIKDIVI